MSARELSLKSPAEVHEIPLPTLLATAQTPSVQITDSHRSYLADRDNVAAPAAVNHHPHLNADAFNHRRNMADHPHLPAAGLQRLKTREGDIQTTRIEGAKALIDKECADASTPAGHRRQPKRQGK